MSPETSPESSELRSADATPTRDSYLETDALLQAPGSFTLPKGPGSAPDTNNILHEFIHPRTHDIGHTADSETVPPLISQVQSAWWKRPSPWWFLVLLPFVVMTGAAEQAPRVAMYTKLVCEVHKPNDTADQGYRLPSNLHMFAPGVVTFMSHDPCASDPGIQTEVAKLQMVLSTVSGVLGCFTAAWLSSFSDRYGRIVALGIMALSFVYDDFHFLLVSTLPHLLPGGYWFYVVGAVIVGLSGGGSGGATGALRAYVADCTEPHERSRLFAIMVGFSWLGGAVGPTIGGLLTTRTGNLLSIFYFSAAIRLVFAFMMWFIVPESLAKATMLESRRLHAEASAEANGAFAQWLHTISSLVAPLAIFLPSRASRDGTSSYLKGNWNLLFIAVSFGISLCLWGSLEYELQYTAAVWKWTTEQIGYWLTITGVTKAVHLSLLLPGITYIFNRPKPAIQLPVQPETPLRSTSSTSSLSETPPHSSQTESAPRRFIFVAFAPNPLTFTIASMVTCFGAGFSPAIQSAALTIYTESGGSEAGKLFGAFSIVEALCIALLGPTIYGVTFMKTIATLPSAIYMLTAVLLTISLFFSLLIRVPKPLNFDGVHHEESSDAIDRVSQDDATTSRLA
ncbi:unnamed protein product [Somion occarium]|uniref:MFS general substrate transporter n=2 Tax=Somion occarium TaxID=3059160 RepID=A0ABP1CGU6_9APHY